MQSSHVYGRDDRSEGAISVKITGLSTALAIYAHPQHRYFVNHSGHNAAS